MGISPDVFDAMTPAEFVYAQHGWVQRSERRTKEIWEVARYVAYISTSVHIDTKHRKPLAEMLPLPWDTSTPTKAQPQLSNEERMERINKIFGHNG